MSRHQQGIGAFGQGPEGQLVASLKVRDPCLHTSRKEMRVFRDRSATGEVLPGGKHPLALQTPCIGQDNRRNPFGLGGDGALRNLTLKVEGLDRPIDLKIGYRDQIEIHP